MARVLIVDDDFQMREMLGVILEHKGYEVTKASNGNKAITLQGEKPFDIIITDIIMPGKEGLETISELRHSYPGLKIIAMSGGGRHRPEGYLELASQYGADRVLAKPFGSWEILGLVRELTSG
ncbi:MAG: response regulator [Candidatus Aminicenantes bacterium]|nr:MAG: response regulator [Candidatus Aminicenantes bacterium]